jgi:gas vesicle protein
MHLEHYDPQASWRGSIWMFVAGTAIGAAAALMMAPVTGRESREYLRRNSRRVADDVSGQAERLASAMRRGQEQASSAMRGTVDQAKSAFSGTMDHAKSAFNAAKSYRQGDEHREGDAMSRQGDPLRETSMS